MRIFSLFSAIQAAAANPGEADIYRFPEGTEIDFVEKGGYAIPGGLQGFKCSLRKDSTIQKKKSAVSDEWEDVECPSGSKFQATCDRGHVSNFIVHRSDGNVAIDKNSPLEEPVGGFKTSELYRATTDLEPELGLGYLGSFFDEIVIKAHFYLEGAQKATITREGESREVGSDVQIAVKSKWLRPYVGCFLTSGRPRVFSKPLEYRMLLEPSD